MKTNTSPTVTWQTLHAFSPQLAAELLGQKKADGNRQVDVLAALTELKAQGSIEKARLAFLARVQQPICQPASDSLRHSPLAAEISAKQLTPVVRTPTVTHPIVDYLKPAINVATVRLPSDRSGARAVHDDTVVYTRSQSNQLSIQHISTGNVTIMAASNTVCSFTPKFDGSFLFHILGEPGFRLGQKDGSVESVVTRKNKAPHCFWVRPDGSFLLSETGAVTSYSATGEAQFRSAVDNRSYRLVCEIAGGNLAGYDATQIHVMNKRGELLLRHQPPAALTIKTMDATADGKLVVSSCDYLTQKHYLEVFDEKLESVARHEVPDGNLKRAPDGQFLYAVHNSKALVFSPLFQKLGTTVDSFYDLSFFSDGKVFSWYGEDGKAFTYPSNEGSF